MRPVAVFVACSLASLTLAVAAGPAPATGPWTFDVSGGYGSWSGETKYQIGGRGNSSDGPFDVGYFPLSELRFPMDVHAWSVGATARLRDRWQFDLRTTTTGETGSGTIEDFDWTEPTNTGLLTIYSRSAGTMKVRAYGATVRFWVPWRALEARGFAVGLGVAYDHETLDWTLRDVDQWYPPNPELGHDIVPGVVGTLESDMTSTGVDAALRYVHKALSVEVGGTFGLDTSLTQTDHHLLRDMVSVSRVDPTTRTYRANVRVALRRHLFLAADVQRETFDASGRSRTDFTAGPDLGTWYDIDYRTESARTSIGLTLGWSSR